MRSGDGNVLSDEFNVRKTKFLSVGLVSLLVSFGSLYLFIDVLQWNRAISYALQTILAIETNYILNNAYTWGDRREGTARRRWLRFHIMRFGFMVPANQVIFFLLQPHLGTILANGMCIAVATIVNWFINDRWVFKARVPQATTPTLIR